MAVLASGDPSVGWIPADGDDGPGAETAFDAVVAYGSRLIDRAAAGDVDAALDAVNGFRLLCGRRRGPVGAATGNERAEAALRPAAARWYVGRPVMVTTNDYVLDLFNGDVGVVVPLPDDRVTVASTGKEGPPSSTPRCCRTWCRSTPPPSTRRRGPSSTRSPSSCPTPHLVLTRELLYTGITTPVGGRCSSGPRTPSAPPSTARWPAPRACRRACGGPPPSRGEGAAPPRPSAGRVEEMTQAP